MLNSLNLGQSILSVRTTDENPAHELTSISSFEIPSLKKILFRGTLICLFYKTSTGRLKVVLLEARRGPNLCDTFETFNDQRLDAYIEELAGNHPLLAEFAETVGYEREALVRTVWSAALCNMPMDDLCALLSLCRLK